MKLSTHFKISLIIIVSAGVTITIGINKYFDYKSSSNGLNQFTQTKNFNKKPQAISPNEHDSTNLASSTVTANSPSSPSVTPIIAGAVSTDKKTTTEIKEACNGSLTTKFICLLNEYRAKNNLSKVTLNQPLTNVAATHSMWMSSSGVFSHTGINETKFYDRCTNAGISCRAENLAEDILEAKKLLSSWQANPSHNKNLLGPYTKVGFGISGEYITLLFD